MYCILVVGMTGQGKSQWAKEYIKDSNQWVFDVQNEYQWLSVNPSEAKARQIDMNEKTFVDRCKQKKNTICLFEEATCFFEGKLDKDLRRVVVAKRHSKNIYLFLFHSISSIPPRLMQLTNYVILFKTGDEPYQVEQKFPSLLPYFMKVKQLPIYQSINIKMIPQ